MAQEANDADPTAGAAFESKQQQKKNRLATAAAASLAAASPPATAAALAASPQIIYLSFLGSRYVRPYSHAFSFSAKKRWWGSPLRAMLERNTKIRSAQRDSTRDSSTAEESA